MCVHAPAGSCEPARKRERRRFARIRGARLECETEKADRRVRRCLALDRLGELRELAVVLFDRRAENDEVIAFPGGERRERSRVLREARAAPAQPGPQMARSDARVKRHRVEDRFGIRADDVREIGDLVDEAELRGEEAVRRVLGELRAAARRPNERDEIGRAPPALAEWRVERFNDRARRRRSTGDDARRGERVRKSAPFAEELRIRDDELMTEPAGLEAIAGPDRYRRPDRNNRPGRAPYAMSRATSST